tara:strand:- start:5822 stop:6484 length:663 start_codon:yes stop_codon:yes gene_type:complete
MAKIVFYSAQTGNRGFIPCIKDQMINDFDYYFIHDSHPEAEDNKGWNYINVKNKFTNFTDCKRQRLIKMTPKQFFPDADYFIWVDCKFYLSKDFYNLCLNIVNEEKPDFMVCRHQNRFSLEQELQYAQDIKQVPIDNLNKVENIYSSSDVSFFSTDTCWLIRKNTEKNDAIGKAWFVHCYENFTDQVRDQLTLPLCVDESYLNLNHSIKELENMSFTLHI